MLRRAAGVCIALIGIAFAAGCSAATPEATAPDPSRQVSPAPPPTRTATPTEPPTPTELPDFKLPMGDSPGWLRYDNPSGPPLIRFSPDSKLLAAAYGGSVHFWDMTTGRQVRALDYDTGRINIFATGQTSITDFDFSPDGTWLAVAASGRLDIWDLAAGTFRSLTAEKFGPYSQVDVSPDGSRLALGPVFAAPAETYNAEIWDTQTWTRRRLLVDAYNLSFSPDSTMVAAQSGLVITRSSYDPGPPVLFDVTTGARRELAVEGFPTSLEYSPDGTLLAVNTIPLPSETGETSGRDGTYLLDVVTGEVRRFIPSPHRYGPLGARFSADGALLAALYLQEEEIIFWDVRSGHMAFKIALDAPAYTVQYLTFSPDGKLVAAVSGVEQRVLFWSMPH